MEMILLAAGLSTRMGSQKLLLPFGEKNVIETVIDNMRDAGFEKINAVFSKEVAAAVTERPEWLRVGINDRPERGQSSSLAIGLSMLAEDSDFCIMLGDLPLVRGADSAALAAQFSAMPEGKTVLAPSRGDVFGHPMFYRAFWKERFAKARGDMGGRDVLRKYDYEIVRVNTSEMHFKDMDTRAEYEKIAALADSRNAAKH